MPEYAVFSGYKLPNGKTINGKYTVVVRCDVGTLVHTARPYIMGTSVPWDCPARSIATVKAWVEGQFVRKVEDWRNYESSHVGKA